MKESPKVVIVGAENISKYAIVEALQEHKDTPIVIVADDTKSINFNFQSQPEPFIISNPYEGLDGIYNKKWVCKGKHQYRQTITEINGEQQSEWVCQCGKYLTSKS